LSVELKTELGHHAFRLGANCQQIWVLAEESEQIAWKQKPKHHYFIAHVPTQADLSTQE